jgi:hypothetical protein
VSEKNSSWRGGKGDLRTTGRIYTWFLVLHSNTLPGPVPCILHDIHCQFQGSYSHARTRTKTYLNFLIFRSPHLLALPLSCFEIKVPCNGQVHNIEIGMEDNHVTGKYSVKHVTRLTGWPTPNKPIFRNKIPCSWARQLQSYCIDCIASKNQKRSHPTQLDLMSVCPTGSNKEIDHRKQYNTSLIRHHETSMDVDIQFGFSLRYLIVSGPRAYCVCIQQRSMQDGYPGWRHTGQCRSNERRGMGRK